MKRISVGVIAVVFAVLSLVAVFAEETLPFTDVSKDKWFYDSVKYVSDNNIMKGIGNQRFDPNGKVTRAQLVETLYRIDGAPEVTGSSSFTDVKADAWYTSAVSWAAENGIVNGFSDKTFKPGLPIIREQAAVILHRYMKYAGESFRGDFNFKLKLYDTAEASDYAIDSIYWMVFKEILEGDNKGYFNPRDALTRAQLAAILTKYLKQSNNVVTDESLERAEKIVEKMSLEEKIGQMIMVDMIQYGDDTSNHNVTVLNGDLAQAIKDYDFGGIILFAQNMAGVGQTTKLIADMQAASERPLLIGTDQEGGSVIRMAQATGFGGNMALAATQDKKSAYEAASVIGKEMSSMGVNVDFAPCLDINTNPDNPVIGTRSFSDNPEVASEFGVEFIRGLHDGGTAAAAKHFPGHGDTATDSHTGLPLVNKPFDVIAQKELTTFITGIKAGTEMIMTAHIQFPKIEKDTYVSKADGNTINIPATLSDDIITGILRNKMGYDGVVITDSMKMDAIAKHFHSKDAAKLAINAGVDMILMPVSMYTEDGIKEMGDYINDIAEMVRDGTIPESEIDDSAARIIKLKIDRGIWDAKAEITDKKVKNAEKIVGCKAHKDLEWDIAVKSVTLRKNAGVLPLKADETEKLGIFFPYNGERPMLDSSLVRMKADGIFDESKINDYVYGSITEDDIGKAIAENDVIVIVSEMGSPDFLKLDTAKGKYAASILKIIDAAHKEGKKAVLISSNLPYDTAFFKDADAAVCTYSCKNSSCAVGAGLCSLFSEPENIKGVLPVKMPA